ncbi:MAG: hypothetical protein LUD19_03560 [Clostridia bacterium]|nr:hypothetical protein [Clostridia bacterium]
MSKGYPIEFCGNCGIGQRTKEDSPYYCNYYSEGKECRCTSWTPGHYLHYERIVYICSPLKGDKLVPLREAITRNLKNATAFCNAAIESYAVPICPHLYFSQFLDDLNSSERNLGMEMGVELLKKCDEMWVFGKPSAGMRAEIEIAESLRIPINYIPQKTIDRILKGDEDDG